MIPKEIKIQDNVLPDNPGVYFYYDDKGKLLYIGKATSLKKRVGSYFTKAHDKRIAELVHRIAKIEYIQTPTVIEALLLEANQIKTHTPPFNILQRDDKSFLYLVITNEDFPKPEFVRGIELERMGINPFSPKLTEKAKRKYLALFGPYTSAKSLRTALELVRKIFPWSTCEPPQRQTTDDRRRARACFYRHIGQCPGVCTGEISKRDYRKIIRNLILFFAGKKGRVIKKLTKEMKKAADELRFEDAQVLKRRIFALNHIQDVALITHETPLPYELREEGKAYIDVMGRVEAYDISNISGTSSVGSMVVFEDGKPVKSHYRKFKIKTVEGANDVASMKEMLRRRLLRAEKYPHAWPLPEIMVIDGGKAQVNAVQSVLDEFGLQIPVLGLAKGFDRKQDRMVFDKTNLELRRVAEANKDIFQRARDEAHRFAVNYHRTLRSKSSLEGKK